jgi:acyl-CoA synthetase (AMP-forming)/AMP-acid ligase II
MNHTLLEFSAIQHNVFTTVELLRYRALHQPEQLAFTFLPDGETEGEQLTYRELDRRSRAIASQLQALGLSGERALLLYPPGLEYLAAFFGCLYAGVVAVPAYPPHNQRNTPRIQAIARDAQAVIALTTTAVYSKVQSLLTEKADLENLQWLATDNLTTRTEENWQEPLIKKIR